MTNGVQLKASLKGNYYKNLNYLQNKIKRLTNLKYTQKIVEITILVVLFLSLNLKPLKF